MPFGHLQALPKDAKAVTEWPNRDKAWVDVVKGIRNAIKEIQQLRIQPPLPFSPAQCGLTAKVPSVLAVLRVCPDRVPLDVLARIVSSSPQDLKKELAPLVTRKALSCEEDCYSLLTSPSQPTQPNDDHILSRALEELLAFIELHHKDEAARNQIVNAVSLAKQCAASDPRRVSGVFRKLDKLLKRRGDKHLILETAELSIEAAQRATRITQVIEGEAHALICGRSWVFQRIGRLPEARVAAEKSLRLGEDIGWDRNTAYCKKCIGRLYRLEAEQEQGRKKVALLLESSAFLKDAIRRFEHLGEFGPAHPEVGDCYSLLGRAYLVARDLPEADAAVKRAHRLIPNDGSKDYLDLLILSGDLQVGHGNRGTAMSFYEQALELRDHDDPEISELRARAYIARGRNREAMSNPKGALFDYEKAAEVYRQLGEVEASANAQWEGLRLKGKIPNEALRLLQGERFVVRVAALALHEKRLSMRSPSSVVARRGAGSKAYWQQILSEAHKQAAVEEREW
jgi:tetratricopeptide (TPR) repeat protein